MSAYTYMHGGCLSFSLTLGGCLLPKGMMARRCCLYVCQRWEDGKKNFFLSPVPPCGRPENWQAPQQVSLNTKSVLSPHAEQKLPTREKLHSTEVVFFYLCLQQAGLKPPFKSPAAATTGLSDDTVWFFEPVHFSGAWRGARLFFVC